MRVYLFVVALIFDSNSGVYLLSFLHTYVCVCVHVEVYLWVCCMHSRVIIASARAIVVDYFLVC